jgi:hypothetical protein
MPKDLPVNAFYPIDKNSKPFALAGQQKAIFEHSQTSASFSCRLSGPGPYSCCVFFLTGCAAAL